MRILKLILLGHYHGGCGNCVRSGTQSQCSMRDYGDQTSQTLSKNAAGDNHLEINPSDQISMCNYFNEDTISTVLIAAAHNKESTIMELDRNRFTRYQTSFQTTLMKLYYTGLQHAIVNMGGMETSRKTTPTQRMDIFKAIFYSNRLRMAKRLWFLGAIFSIS